MKKLLFTLALTAATLVSYAQSSTRPGYIITSDTVRGSVVYREGMMATEMCSFIEGAAEARNYGPADIKGYGFESRHFVTTRYKGKAQFMEVIAEGDIELLRSHRLYYLRKDTAFVALESVATSKIIKGVRYESEDKVWLSRVKPLFRDCPATATAFDGMELSALSPQQIERRFSKAIADYNACHGQKTVVHTLEKGKHGLVSVGVMAGIAIPGAWFTNDGGTQTFNGGAFPAFGVSLEYANRRFSERLKVRTEVSFTKASWEESNEYDVSYRLQYSTVKVPVLVHYSFSSRRIAPFVRAGIVANIFNNNKFEQEYQGRVSEPYELKSFTLPFMAAAGLESAMGKKMHAYFDVRYEFPTVIYDNIVTNRKIRTSMVAVLVGVRF